MKLYHETLGAALVTAIAYAAEAKAVINESELTDQFSNGGVSYGETRNGDVEIESLKGKGTRKWFHVVIYRMDSGTYELTCYIL